MKAVHAKVKSSLFILQIDLDSLSYIHPICCSPPLPFYSHSFPARTPRQFHKVHFATCPHRMSRLETKFSQEHWTRYIEIDIPASSSCLRVRMASGIKIKDTRCPNKGRTYTFIDRQSPKCRKPRGITTLIYIITANNCLLGGTGYTQLLLMVS